MDVVLNKHTHKILLKKINKEKQLLNNFGNIILVF